MPKNSSIRSMRSRTKNSELIQIPVPKGQRELIKQYAKSRGMSMNEFIRNAINSQIEKDLSLSLSKNE